MANLHFQKGLIKFKETDFTTFNINWQEVNSLLCKRKINYCKNPKIRTPEKFAVITLNFEQDGFTIEYCIQKDADWIANSVDPDQTSLFAQTYLSENLGSLR